MTPETLSAMAGALLSLLLNYVPGLNAAFDRMAPDRQRFVMALLLAVAAAGMAAWSCAAGRAVVRLRPHGQPSHRPHQPEAPGAGVRIDPSVIARLADYPPCPICGVDRGEPCRKVPKAEVDFPGIAIFKTNPRQVRDAHAARRAHE